MELVSCEWYVFSHPKKSSKKLCVVADEQTKDTDGDTNEALRYCKVKSSSFLGQILKDRFESNVLQTLGSSFSSALDELFDSLAFGFPHCSV